MSTVTATDRSRQIVRWAGSLLPVVAIGVMALLAALWPGEPHAPVAGRAPDLVLPATDGSTISLDRVLRDADGGVLLYFSMGVGCGGCFAQIPEAVDELAARGVVLVPVMVDDAALVRVEAERYGAGGPIAIDRDRSVSEAYGMLGAGAHGDSPSHSFVLVAPDRTVTAVVHYTEMFVPADRLIADLSLGAAGPTAASAPGSAVGPARP